ncbi:MAG: recombinase family protein [Caldilineaceae bacterium]|nr:recombinase family protein [Caldilineaceae bacterium]
MKFGYARVSPHDQHHDRQLDALRAAGCERIFTDNCSGSTACADRPQLQQLRDRLRAGDVIVIWKLDRLGRNLRDLLTFVSDLEGDGIEFISLTEQMDTTTMGRLVFQIFGALAEYERSLISERTKAGLASARARGRKGGRGRKFGDAQVRRAAELLRAGQLSVDEICATMGIGRTTLYRYLTPEGEIRKEPRP